MTTQARVIGPASELGHFDTLNFFGNEIGREFTDVTLCLLYTSDAADE